MIRDYENSKVCQQCGRCCEEYWCYTTGEDEAVRLSLLDTDLIKVEQIRPGLWCITIRIVCRHFRTQATHDHGWRSRTCSCDVHDGPRPDMCREFPLNILETGDRDMIHHAKTRCLVLQEMVP